MSDEILLLGRQSLRGTDSNSLLRLYDQMSDILRHSFSQGEKTRAEKVIQRVATELAKRHIPFDSPRPREEDGCSKLLR